MRRFTIGIEHPLHVTVQRLHDPDPRHNRVSAAAAQHQDLDRRLPFGQIGFLLRQLRDVVGCVFQGEERPTVRQRNRILKRGGPGNNLLGNDLGCSKPAQSALLPATNSGMLFH